ncbi:MAG: cation diffusion facilitator family transporter, partial [Rikenellaceae bacterium]
MLVSKFIAYWLTNSAGILTDALESIVNVIAGVITLISLGYALKPRDSNHPFGHGKVELISASLEGILIFFAGVMIIIEGTNRLFHPTELRQLDVGLWIVAAAGASIHIGKKHDSIALIAGGKHLQSDTYSSIGLVAGLLLLYFTKIEWIDSALAIVFGVIIIVTGISILYKTIGRLIDRTDEETVKNVVGIINNSQRDDWVDVHNLKIIKYGTAYHIDCDITLPWYMNIRDGHQEADFLEEVIEKAYPEQIMFSIHFDPCKPYQCTHCRNSDCPHRTAAFTTFIPLDYKTLTSMEN